MYPKVLYKTKEIIKIANNPSEEYKAGLDGYERHWMPVINEKQKGSSKEILRVNPDKLVFDSIKGVCLTELEVSPVKKQNFKRKKKKKTLGVKES